MGAAARFFASVRNLTRCSHHKHTDSNGAQFGNTRKTLGKGKLWCRSPPEIAIRRTLASISHQRIVCGNLSQLGPSMSLLMADVDAFIIATGRGWGEGGGLQLASNVQNVNLVVGA